MATPLAVELSAIAFLLPPGAHLGLMESRNSSTDPVNPQLLSVVGNIQLFWSPRGKSQKSLLNSLSLEDEFQSESGHRWDY